MIINYHKITIINSRKPAKLGLNQKLQWLASSLGLLNERDKENSCFRIFIELIKASKQGEGYSSDELAYLLGLTRGTIVHHLNRLMESGLVVVEKNKYFLRVTSLKELIDEVEKDMKRTLDELKKVGEELDMQLGL